MQENCFLASYSSCLCSTVHQGMEAASGIGSLKAVWWSITQPHVLTGGRCSTLWHWLHTFKRKLWVCLRLSLFNHWKLLWKLNFVIICRLVNEGNKTKLSTALSASEQKATPPPMHGGKWHSKLIAVSKVLPLISGALAWEWLEVKLVWRRCILLSHSEVTPPLSKNTPVY